MPRFRWDARIDWDVLYSSGGLCIGVRKGPLSL